DMSKVTAQIGQKHYITTIRSSGNEIVADEPRAEGGEDAGFAPDELLAASLAACTSITLRMYADRKAWPMESVEVEVNFERDSVAKTSTIVRRIKFFGTLDDEQKHRLLQIADKCPVHLVLTHPITIQTALA
ncbi:MAG: OsmC family protein, partial [Saprospiraceae bacterium]|nr:OsmC family protein [Saprospiraceae bacterium]